MLGAEIILDNWETVQLLLLQLLLQLPPQHLQLKNQQALQAQQAQQQQQQQQHQLQPLLWIRDIFQFPC